MTLYVGYARVSTARQGRSGLGLEAQEAAIAAHLRIGDELLAPLYVETESGKTNDRPELAKALGRAKRAGATLIVAKLDRLSRNVAFIAQLMESGVSFVACDMPTANELTVHIMAAVAQAERKAISLRTKDALAAAKARGKRLGGYRSTTVVYDREGQDTGQREARLFDGTGLSTAGVQARQGNARAFAGQAMETIVELREAGVTGLSGIARGLNAQGVRTSRGGDWTATQVRRVIASVNA